MTARPPALELRKVSGGYRGTTVVHDLDLVVENGELVSLLGPSGCGKSTTLRLIVGLATPQSGEIAVLGRSMLGVPPHRRAMGVVFQDYALFPHMTVAENVAYGLRMRGVGKAEQRDRVAAMMDRVGLTPMAARYPSVLSGGQRQRVALARALAIQPDLLLLDEPLAALDRQLRVRMQSELRHLQRSLGIATIFVTHDQEEAMVLSDRIVVMEGGRVADIGPPRRVYREPRSRFALEFLGGCSAIAVDVTAPLEGGGAIVHASGGLGEIRVTRALDCSPAVGQRAWLALRAEHLHVAAVAPDAPHAATLAALGGVLEELNFIGPTTQSVVRVGSDRVEVTEPSAAVDVSTSGLRPGDPVLLTWPQGQGWLLKD